MAFENIQIQHGNFTISRSGATFFTLDHTNQRLIEKTSAAVVVFSYLLDTPIVEVQSLQFDGYYFWSLERQGNVGFTVRKWQLTAANVLQVVDTFSHANNAVDKYDTYALAVESYSDSFDNLETAGTTVFDVVDGSVIRIGDRIVAGPSTSVGFEGTFSFTVVTGKPSDNTIEVSRALDKVFNPNDKIYFTRSFFVFSDTAPAGLTGALYKYRSRDGLVLAFSVSNMFNKIRAATFFKGHVMFVKGGEVIWLDPDSQNIAKLQAIDTLNEDRAEYYTTYDLAGFSNTIYRLEQKKVYYNVGTGQYNTESWSPLYNYNTSSVIPEVYFIAVKADPPLIHRLATGVPVYETESTITVTVLDQFRTPVFNKIVDFTSNGGPLSSIQETTNSNGQVKVEYTANSTLGDVTITAIVT